MDSGHEKGRVGDFVTGQTVHCEYRKSDRERLIRRTAEHRGRSVCLHHATCTVTKEYRQARPKAAGRQYRQPEGGR